MCLVDLNEIGLSRGNVLKAAVYRGHGSPDVLEVKEVERPTPKDNVIDGRYPFEQIADAHRYVDTGRKRGNVIMTLEHRH
jgi:NADPH:quinone reductase-like Zn-dependent oxidoreductase